MASLALKTAFQCNIDGDTIIKINNVGDIYP